jgi:molybdopterin-guanine dinucleotide biosynthesis protein
MGSLIISEFIQALEAEIKALKSGKGGTTTRIFNGRFINKYSDYYIYSFTLNNFLTVFDETPAEIDIRGQHYNALIFRSEGLNIEVGIDNFCGQSIPEATLLTNLWYLLEILKNKYTDCQDGTLNVDFKLSEMLFLGNNAKYKIKQESIKYSQPKKQLNDPQKKAISASFSSPLCIIWGPPGTGKTTTIACAIEAHINAGRRVLLVSHANNAVDEALEDVAEQMNKTPFYEQGQLVRLGKPKDETKFEKYSMVLLEKIKEAQGESLENEKKDLENKKFQLEKDKVKLVEVININQNVNNISSELAKIKELISQYDTELISNQRELQNLKSILSDNNRKLSEAKSAGTIKRFIKRLDPQKIESDIESYRSKITFQESLIRDKVSNINNLKISLNTKNTELDTAQHTVNFMLRELHLSIDDVKNQVGKFDREIEALSKRITEIKNELEEIEKKILSNAKLIATTLTKTFSSKSFPDKPFDVLILDEASMAPLPFLYWAVSRCQSFITIVGDFLQLPPICIADDNPKAKKWLGRSIFDVLGIDSVESACSNNHINLLNIQYRMNPKISEIPNEFIYNGLLSDSSEVNQYPQNDGISDYPLVLVDTSTANPWCSKLPKSRFNLYSAVVSASIARKIFKSVKTIGIVTPYTPQARLINKIISDWKLGERVRVGNVHNFQGGQADVIIFDCVESPGVYYIAPMIDECKGKESDAPKLLNVAITRSGQRFYFVGHIKYLQSKLSQGCVLRKIVNHLLSNSEAIDSRELVDSFSANSFDELSETLLSNGNDKQGSLFETTSFSEKNFWPSFKQDLKSVKQEVIIFSPFITIKRSGQFMDYFRALRSKGIEIHIHTRPPNQQTGGMQKQSEIVIDQFENMGIKVAQRSKMHQKVAIFDSYIAWTGSLNILSHSDTQEYMARFEGESAIKDIIKNLEMQDEEADGAITDILCPECGLQMVVRSKYGNKFLGCSGYSKGCKMTMKLPYKETESD